LQIVFTFLVGPFAALLPQRWRESLPSAGMIQWRLAVMLSGLLEAFSGLVALIYWYSISVEGWVRGALDAGWKAHPNVEFAPNTVGFAGLYLVALHPLTWIIVYIGLEGVVRFCAAAFTGEVFGVSLLFLVDRVLHGKAPKNLAPLADELYFSEVENEKFLEIRSVHPKSEWEPPRILRYQGVYYRLEMCSHEPPPRPFVYRFRRLTAGVPGLNVIYYRPEPEPVIADETSLSKQA
jgi:hypothetical protein